jgi:methionine synthase I (cobalamin-dependent)
MSMSIALTVVERHSARSTRALSTLVLDLTRCMVGGCCGELQVKIQKIAADQLGGNRDNKT